MKIPPPATIQEARARLQTAADLLSDPTEIVLVRREDLLLAIEAMDAKISAGNESEENAEVDDTKCKFC